MAKIQIMKLTKELKDEGVEVTNKDIIAFLNSKGVDVSNHMQSIEDGEIKLVRERFAAGASSGGSAENSGKEKPAAKPATAEGAAKEAAAPKPEEARPKSQAQAGNAQNSAPEHTAQAQGAPAKKPVLKKKRPNIIVSSNQFAKNGRPQNGGRQIVHISGGKIEEQPRVKKVFKHVEVTSPDSFKPKKEEVPEVKPEVAKAPKAPAAE